MLKRVVAGKLQRIERPVLHFRHVPQQGVAGLNRQVTVDPAGDRAGPVDFLAGRRLDDVLPELPHQDRPAAKFGLFPDHLEYVALFRRRAEPEQEIRRGQMKEMQNMALHHLSVVHQPPHLFGGRRKLIDPADNVHRLGRCQMVTDRTNPAEPLHDDWDFPEKPAANKPLKAAELDNMQPRLVDIAVPVQVNRHLAVALDPRHRRDFDQSRLRHGSCSPVVAT